MPPARRARGELPRVCRAGRHATFARAPHERAGEGGLAARILSGQPAEEEVHELSLMEDLVSCVLDELADARVHVVRIEVGRHACASPHALRFCFEICARGTPLERAALDIVETSGAELRLREIEVS